MTLRLKIIAAGALAGLVLSTFQSVAQTAAYPNQRITVVVPAVAGGASDIIGRIMSQHLQKTLGQSIIVENRGGASGSAGAIAVVRAAPDGYTLFLATSSQVVINQFVLKNIGYDPLNDLVPIAFVAAAPELVTIPSTFPATSWKEFLAALKSKPGAYNFGTPGAGTPPHLAIERIMQVTGTKMAHVPFRGSAAVMIDVAAGNIQMSMATLASIEPFRQAGTARILAVAADKRLKALPDIPTLEEAGLPDMEMSVWWGVMGPKGISRDIVQLLNAKLREAFSNPENTATLDKLGITTFAEPTEMFEKFIQKEVKMYESVVKGMGLEPQ